MQTPIDATTFEFSGRRYTLEYDLLAQVTLDGRGVDTTRIHSSLTSSGNIGKAALSMELFAAMAANNFDVEKGETIPTAAAWTKRLNGDLEKFTEACKAVSDVLIKVWRAAQAKLPAQPASTTADPKPN